MSPESSATPRPWAAVWSTVRTDRWVQLVVVAFAVISLAELLAAAGGRPSPSATHLALAATATLIFRGLLVAALWSNLDQIQIRERRFWNDVGTALSLWLLVAFLELLLPPGERALGLTLLIEAVRVASYVALFLAAERSPDRSHRWRSTDLERALAWPTATAFTLGLFAYFLLVPGLGSPSGQIPRGLSHLAHLLLATYLVTRFAHLARGTHSSRWRLLYSILTWALAVAALDHLLRWRLSAGDSPAWAVPIAAVLGNAPYLAIVLVRARHLAFSEEAHRSRFDESSDFHFNRPSHQTLLHALAFPLLHFGCYRLGLFDPDLRASHEALAVGMLTLLGAISLVQLRLLESKARDLWFDREKVEGSLRSSETDLRLMVERYHADQKVRLSEEKFAKAFQVSPDAMAITALADGRLKDVNDRFVSITGYSREELLGRTTAELNMWVDPAQRDKMARTLARDGVVRQLEGRFRTKSGDVIVGLFSAEQLIIEGEPYLLSVTHDITERKRMEARLDEQIELLEKAAGIKLPTQS